MQYIFKYIETPLFMLNSAWDTFQLANILNCTSAQGCPQYNKYGQVNRVVKGLYTSSYIVWWGISLCCRSSWLQPSLWLKHKRVECSLILVYTNVSHCQPIPGHKSRWEARQPKTHLWNGTRKTWRQNWLTAPRFLATQHANQWCSEG